MKVDKHMVIAAAVALVVGAVAAFAITGSPLPRVSKEAITTATEALDENKKFGDRITEGKKETYRMDVDIYVRKDAEIRALPADAVLDRWRAALDRYDAALAEQSPKRLGSP